MITTAIINLAYTIISGIINRLPSSSGFPPEVIESATYIGGQAAMLNMLIPLDTMATVIGIVYGVEIAIFGFKTVRAVFAYVPFIGGKG